MADASVFLSQLLAETSAGGSPPEEKKVEGHPWGTYPTCPTCPEEYPTGGVPGDDSPGWSLIRRLWDAGYSLTLERGADGRPVLVPIGHGRTDDELFRLFDRCHDDAVEIVQTWPPWMTDPAVLLQLPAADTDGWPAGAIPWIDPKPWPPN